MGLTPFSSLLICSAVWLSQPGDGEDWQEVWAQCHELSSSPAPSSAEELSVLRGLLEGAAHGPRLDVAQYHLARALGDSPEMVPCSELPELSPMGAWAFGVALTSGPSLDCALLQALDPGQGAQLSEASELLLLQRAFQRFLEHSEAADGPAAAELAESLHARANASWSAMNLAISKTRDGSYGEAADALAAAIDASLTPSDRAILQSRLTLVYLGWGGILLARGHLGAGLTEASSDSRIVLGLLALEQGLWGRSRALFRSVMASDPNQAWAGRGWGLSMVPPGPPQTN